MDKLFENSIVRYITLGLLLLIIGLSVYFLNRGFSGEGTFIENISGKEYRFSFEIYKAHRQSDEDKTLQSEFFEIDPILIYIYNDSVFDADVIYTFSSGDNEIQKITIPIPAESSRSIAAPADLPLGTYTVKVEVEEQVRATSTLTIIDENSDTLE